MNETALLREHTELGDTAMPVALLALVIWWRQREAATPATEVAGTGGSRGTTATRRRTYLAPLSITITSIVTVLAVVIAGFAVYDTYRMATPARRPHGPTTSAPHPPGTAPVQPDGG